MEDELQQFYELMFPSEKGLTLKVKNDIIEVKVEDEYLE
jgi:hypothetical protein